MWTSSPIPLRAGGPVPIGDRPSAAEAAAALAPAYKALGNPIRLQLVFLMASASPDGLTLAHLSERLDLPAPLVSHHLRLLRFAGLVEVDRRRPHPSHRIQQPVLHLLGNILCGAHP
ncbi:winged helix-turn-helix transcriptional regulator [Dactylosporangium vinaceum]|uniref:ArsR/SmtB family transcription factor n=1 Tax=Dactylosporangium vinaceum TaxID=53362 RepID=A0ABV5MAK8_9ACTN|nr:ArsR family transcriptional regulator [Dactylosporangium vinaceum]UAB92944.1 winged helix-turn-helix transcriptional regulator [Dactylosporangium vinaceum]